MARQERSIAGQMLSLIEAGQWNIPHFAPIMEANVALNIAVGPTARSRLSEACNSQTSNRIRKSGCRGHVGDGCSAGVIPSRLKSMVTLTNRRRESYSGLPPASMILPAVAGFTCLTSLPSPSRMSTSPDAPVALRSGPSPRRGTRSLTLISSAQLRPPGWLFPSGAASHRRVRENRERTWR